MASILAAVFELERPTMHAIRRARLLLRLWLSMICVFQTVSAHAQLDAGVQHDADADAGFEAEPAEYGAVATATRLARPLRLVASAVTVIPRAELDRNPALTTDSVLRSVPSLATFRRSTSLTADPSSQGLNLRGVGPSGVSRSLVLLDGVPVNDPFAGSVYFRGLPRLGLARAEIVPGGGSALYGSSALSGVVQLFSRDSRERAYEGQLSYGSFDTWLAAARAAGGSERVSGALESEWLKSDGYKVVAKNQRGPIDRAAASEHVTLNGKIDLRATKHLTLGASASLFREQLRHSTRYTSASVRLGTAALRASYDAGTRGTLSLLWFGRLARFNQERARIAAERVSEERAARQRVPAGDTGGSLTWSSPMLCARRLGRCSERGENLGHQLLAGVDARFAQGTSHERLFPPDSPALAVRSRSAGGRQLLLGAFVQDLWRLRSYLQLEAALRIDLIRNERGRSTFTRFSGEPAATDFAADSRFAFNPRLGVLLEPHRSLRVRASGYRSFRAATLNELYRPFQVGTVLTAANAQLQPETLTGAELGVESRAWEALTLRAVGFFNLLDDPIVNATLSTPLPDGSMRQRKNLGRARIAGLELSSDLRLFGSLSLLLAYTYADSRVTREGAVSGLRGKRLAQDPLHRASALLYFDEPRWLSASLQLRYVGAQYEDDLNTLRMRGYAILDALVARRLVWKLELYAAVENLWNQAYLVGRAGVDTIGQPFMARVGLRIRDGSAR